MGLAWYLLVYRVQKQVLNEIIKMNGNDCLAINNIVRQRGRKIDWKITTLISGQIRSLEADIGVCFNIWYEISVPLLHKYIFLRTYNDVVYDQLPMPSIPDSDT